MVTSVSVNFHVLHGLEHVELLEKTRVHDIAYCRARGDKYSVVIEDVVVIQIFLCLNKANYNFYEGPIFLCGDVGSIILWGRFGVIF